MNVMRATRFLTLAIFLGADAYSSALISQEDAKHKNSLENEASFAAVVNDKGILKSDLEARVRLVMVSGGLENTPEVRAQIKDQILKLMIDEALQIQMTAPFGIKATDEDVENAFGNMEERNGMSKGDLDRFLEAQHIPRSILVDQIKAGIAWHRYIQERYQPLIQISDKDVTKVLDHVEKNKSHQHVLLAEIVLPFDAADESKVKTEALHLIDQLRRGANFSMVAQQVSHSASAGRGGDIGWVPLSQLDKHIREAVSKMKQGDISDPIKTQNAYHIVILRNLREAGSFGTKETIITFQQALFPFPPNSSESEMEAIFRKAASMRQNAKSPGMFEKLVKGIPSAQFKVANKVPLTDLNPQLRELLVELPLNEATKPIGSDIGILVFFISEKQTISPDAPTKEEVYRNIMEQKLSLIAQRELRNLRRTAFINIRT